MQITYSVLRWLMSKKCKMIVYLIISSIIFALLALIVYLVIHFGVIQANFILKGDKEVSIALNETYEEKGYDVYYHFKSYKDEVVITSNVDETNIGEYKITYKVPRLNKQVTRTIHVVDKIKPLIKLNGNQEVFTFVNNEYIDEGASAIDNNDGDL
ncbi:MAG: DUF5011 domain-containing protein, partial [Erysipelotrichia bacterium]|nr:DUF5011 domain-containing protein [Erysipelotrichia bacterium]